MKNFYSEIKEVQDNNCNDSLRKVIDRYSPVFISMYSKYMKPITDCGADPNDILSDKDLIIYESAKSFDLGERSSFCTWLSNNVKYKCLHMISKQTKKQVLADRFKRNSDSNISDYPYKNIEMNKFIFNTLNKIKDKRSSAPILNSPRPIILNSGPIVNQNSRGPHDFKSGAP